LLDITGSLVSHDRRRQNLGVTRDLSSASTNRKRPRADFAADGVVRYAVAFPASATIALRPTAVHVDIERRKREIVAIEADDADARLHARETSFPRLGALSPIEPATQPRFGFLEVADDRSHLPTRSLPA
jgi:hypothetical protein